MSHEPVELSSFVEAVTAQLEPYQLKVECTIKEHLAHLFGEKTQLRDACEYALLNGGKRFRPAIVLMISEAIGAKTQKMWDAHFASIAVEFVHTASLIADDLPCMDNDDERRGKPSSHKLYGESIALLSTYALISAGYSSIVHNVSHLKKIYPELSQELDQRGMLALQNASYNTGAMGATGGQYLDLYPKEVSVGLIEEIIRKKTTSVFEVAFVFGWLFGGGEIHLLDQVKRASHHFGNAFQIADDILDIHQDALQKKPINIATATSKQEALQLLERELKQFEMCWESLHTPSDPLIQLVRAFQNYFLLA